MTETFSYLNAECNTFLYNFCILLQTQWNILDEIYIYFFFFSSLIFVLF